MAQWQTMTYQRFPLLISWVRSTRVVAASASEILIAFRAGSEGLGFVKNLYQLFSAGLHGICHHQPGSFEAQLGRGS